MSGRAEGKKFKFFNEKGKAVFLIGRLANDQNYLNANGLHRAPDPQEIEELDPLSVAGDSEKVTPKDVEQKQVGEPDLTPEPKPNDHSQDQGYSVDEFRALNWKQAVDHITQSNDTDYIKKLSADDHRKSVQKAASERLKELK